MMDAETDFGTLTGMTDAGVLQEYDLPSSGVMQEPQITGAANVLWEYKNKSSVHGFRVADDAKGLPLTSASLLEAALVPCLTPKVFVCWLSPDHPEGLKAYSDLLKRSEEREIVIDEESRQYDQSKSAFMVFVRYDEIIYRLHDRYNYLKEDVANV